MAVSKIWENFREPVVTKFIPTIAAVRNTPLMRLEPVGTYVSIWDWLLMLFIGGYILLLVRTFAQFLSFARLRRKANLISNAGPKIYHIEANIQPFSFWDSFSLNRSLHPEEDLVEIIRGFIMLSKTYIY